jgi:hypothetical protein
LAAGGNCTLGRTTVECPGRHLASSDTFAIR